MPVPCCYMLATSCFAVMSGVLLGLAIFTEHWDNAKYNVTAVTHIARSRGVTPIQWLGGKVLWIGDDTAMKGDNDTRLEDVFHKFITNTHSGLWETCFQLTLPEITSLQSHLPWFDSPCYSHAPTWSGPITPKIAPRWVRLSNLSISCCLTALIIIAAGVFLGCVGLIYKQVACILVLSVMYVLASIFTTFSLSIQTMAREDRSKHKDPSLAPTRTITSSWSLQLGWIAVLVTIFSALLIYILSRIMRSRFKRGTL